jgi:thiamine biosynthesis lipoprotein
MRKLPTLLLLLAAAVSCIKEGAPAAGKLKRYEATREMMGTFVTVTVWAPTRQKAVKATDAAFARIGRLERLMNAHRIDSEVSKVNSSAYQQDVVVSDEMLDVLALSLQYSRLSGGAFDISIAPLWKLWKSAERSGILPDHAAIRSVLPSVGYENIKLNEKKRTVRFLKPSMEIDLGGIAKGYAVDCALGALREHGITAALVDAGGDIAAVGRPPNAKTWRIGVRKPGLRGTRMPEIINLTAGAVATSGDYERYVEIAGKRFSHIIDPRTGSPVEGMSSVTVIAPDATAADALATTCSVLGPVEGLNLAARLDNVEVMYIIASDSGPLTIKSHGFDGYADR